MSRRTWLLPLPLSLLGCAPGIYEAGPILACKGVYAPLDQDAETSLGYSAQDAIDRFGLDHAGQLTWRFVDGVIDDEAYVQPMPADSDAQITLTVDFVRWARNYTVRPFWGHRNDLIARSDTRCPVEGLEVRLEGVADFPELAMSVPLSGWLLATHHDGNAAPGLDDLSGFSMSGLLIDDALQPLRDSLDAYFEIQRERHPIQETHTIDSLEVGLDFSFGVGSADVAMDTRWHQWSEEFDASVAATMPFAPTLVLDTE